MQNSENLPCFSQTPLRAEQDARMSELEGLHRRLSGTGGTGMSRLWSYLGQWNTLSPTNTELAILWEPWHQPTVTHTCNPTFYMTDSCVSTTLKILKNTPHKDWRSSLAGGRQWTICKDPRLTALLRVIIHSVWNLLVVTMFWMPSCSRFWGLW